MAPEQFAGQPADARSDLHALGVTLFEMLAGAPPYDGESVAEIEASIAQGKRRALPRGVAPEALVRLVDQLLATEPRDRPAHARAVAERLRHVIDAFPPEVVTRTSYARTATPERGSVLRLWPLGVIAVAVAGLVYWFQRPVVSASAAPVPVVLYFEGNAELSIDGVAVGTAREPFRTELVPGRHRLEARVYDSGRTLARDVVIVPGGEAQIRLE
jgi:serine/threonine-protein kinase